ncbi:unnamed protein product [Scytosiphon promiscuus]
MRVDCKAGMRVGKRAGSWNFQHSVVTRDRYHHTAQHSRSRGYVSTDLARTAAMPDRGRPPSCHLTQHAAAASSVPDTHKRARQTWSGNSSYARFTTLRRAPGRLPVQVGSTLSSGTGSGNRNGSSNSICSRASRLGSTMHTQGQRRFIRGGGQHFPHSDQDSLGLFARDSNRRVIKPERIIIVRHGESLGNLDESTYVHVPDWKIPLTKKGFGDGQRAGEKIKEYIGDKPLFIYTSPYLRTKQTLAGMVEAFDTNYIVGVREEPRLTEQQFGNFQNLATIVNSKAERARFGRFYYRFPQGESGLDVYNRATSFIATMFRDFANESIAREDLNVIIVTHGLTLRLLVMRWFQYSIADFEETLNPANGGFVVMERRAKEDTDPRFFGEESADRRDLRHWYELTPESRAHINFKQQRQFGSLWKLLSELPDEPGVLPEEFINKSSEEPKKK